MSTVLIENIVTQQCLDDAIAALQATCCQPLPTTADSGSGSIPVAGPLTVFGAGNVTTSASGNTITVAGASSALIDNGDGTYSFMPSDGSAPTEILTSTLVANADGSYTFTSADGSTVVIPADCCPTLTDNGDGTYTFTAGDGSTVIFATHPATTVTSNAAPFSWNGATQTLNVPQAPALVANADGSYTFTAGNGSAPVVIPADCCPTLTANADGSFTFTAGNGSTVTIPALPIDIRLANAVIDTTTNEMVLTLNDGTEYRVPLSALLPVVTDGVTVVGDGTVGDPLSAGYFVDNGDGTYTWNGADGSSFTIPADCCPTLTDNGDGTFTFTDGGGNTVTFATHPATTVTSNAAPFSWNAATQTLNVPQAPTLVANADGSHTFNSGDGSAPLVIPADCCPTLTDNGDGTFTFTAGDGSTVTFATHPAAALTNNAAPFAWNGTTQTGNIPQSPALTLTASGFTFTAGNGSAPVSFADKYVSGFSIAGNTATLTLSDGTTLSQTIPTTIDINVQSFSLSGTDLILTETDGTVHTVALPQEIKVSAVSYNSTTGLLTVTNSDGTTATATIPTHPATTVTSNAAPFSWNAATQTLNVPQAPTLVLNADGSYTFTAGNGSAPVVIPADCCPTLVDNGDGTFTFTDGDGNTVIFATHPATTVTSNAAPFAWNGATQTLNVPQAPALVANGDGSHTFTAGDGSAPVIIPADCCPTLVANADGSFTFTAGDGSTVVIPALPIDIRLANAVIDTATNEMVLTLNDGTEYRVPLSALLPVVSDGVTVVGDGTVGDPLSAGYLADNGNGTYTWNGADGSGFTIPADCCPTLTDNGDGTYTFTAGDGSTTTIAVHPAAAVTNNAAPFVWNAATQTLNVPQAPTLVANGDGSHTFTAGDGSAPVVIPADCCPTLTDNDGTYIFTAGDGSTTTFVIHPAVALTNNAAPFTWNGTTQTGNIPQAPALVDNGDGSYTFTAGDGSAPVTIPSSLLSGLNGLLNGLTTTQQIADVIDDWTKQVVNSGATLPIANVADAGAQPLLTGGQLQIGETDEIIPTIGADGVLRMTERIVYGHSTIPSAQLLPPTTFTQINYSQVIEDTHGAIQADGSWIVPVDGIYEICAGWQDLARDKTTFQETEVSIQVFVNGTFTRRIGYGNFGPYSDASVNPGAFGCGLFRLTRGQVVTLRGNNTATIPLNTPMQADANPIVTYMNFLKVK